MVRISARAHRHPGPFGRKRNRPMANTADAVVIGGGINGTNIAWWLARRKVGKVILLEKSAIASGASGKSGALVGSHFGTEIKVRLALKAMETWKNFNDVYRVKGEYYDR